MNTIAMNTRREPGSLTRARESILMLPKKEPPGWLLVALLLPALAGCLAQYRLSVKPSGVSSKT